MGWFLKKACVFGSLNLTHPCFRWSFSRSKALTPSLKNQRRGIDTTSKLELIY